MISKRHLSFSILSLGLLCLTASLPLQANSKIGEQRIVTPKIIGGADATKNAYPFITAIVSAYSNANSINPFCGGSFIGERYVLTAAHCVDGSSPEDIDVWIGGHDLNVPSEGQRISVQQIYMHEQYDDFSNNKDIAILKLSEVVSSVEPIKLMTPSIEATINEGDMFTIMGWGNTNTSASDGVYLDILRETQVPLYNRQACLAAYPSPSGSAITEFMMCAGFVEGGQDTCQGDSGGPMIYRHEGQWYQAGVVSFGEGCAQANYPGIYTRVSQLLNWLAQKREGVSYRQNNDIGYVGAQYKEDYSISVTNLTGSAFTISNVQLLNELNLVNPTISDNQCEGTVLANLASCEIKVDTSPSMVGNSSFTLSATTNTALSTPIEINVSLSAINLATLDMETHVGSNVNFITWFSGGNRPWQVSSSRSDDNISSVASGNISDLESSVLLATINDAHAKRLNYKYWVSSEKDYDYFNVIHNGETILSDSGNIAVAFKSGSVTLKPGNNRIAFVYEKDESFNEGDDKAYLDTVSITTGNENPIIVINPSTLSVEEETQFTLDASATSDVENDSLSYNWEVIGVASAIITSPRAVSTTITAPKYADYRSISVRLTVNDSYGGVSQKTVNVTITQNPANVVTPPPVVTPTPSNEGGGGSLGFFSLLFLGTLTAYRKRTNS